MSIHLKYILPLLCLILSLSALRAQVSATPEATESSISDPHALTGSQSAIQAKLEALPTEQQEKFRAHLKQASDLIGRDRLLEAFREIDEAEKIFPDYPALYNLRGASWVRLKEIEKARKAFAIAQSLNPDAFDVRFNLAELLFVERKFEQAMKSFQEITDKFPKLPSAQYDLIEYKKQICHLQLGQEEKARKIKESFSYTDDSPAYYYSKAAEAYANNDEGDATGWIQSASNIYQPGENQLYLDSLIEMGWVQALDKPTTDKE